MWKQNLNDCLEICLEDSLNGNFWYRSFTADAIEEITKKSGSFKKIQVFISILALARDSHTNAKLSLLSRENLVMFNAPFLL